MSIGSVIGRLKAVLFTGVMLFSVFAGADAWGQAAAKEESGEGIDAVLLLDSSGSMLLTDPLRLRDEGAKLFVEFLKSDDRLGVVEFSDGAKVVRPLGPISSDDRANVAQLISQIKTVGKYTDLLAPLEVAESLFAGSSRQGARKILIMLSDGKMEPDPKSGNADDLTNRLLNTEIPNLKAKEIQVYTLSFSDLADGELLSQIAAGTGGVHRFAPSADKIHSEFAELFVAAKKPQMLPISSKGFRIDADVQEATFYINRQGEPGITVISPGGVRVTSESKSDGIKWFKGSEFDVITIEAPEAGQWEIVGLPKNEGFATLLTSLKLVTTWPSAINAGNPTRLEVRLYEAKKPIILPQMTGVVTYAFDITPTDKVSEPIMRAQLSDDGGDQDLVAKDGVYSALVEIEDPGEYRLRVLADGPTFSRYQQQPFRVKPRLVTLESFKERAGYLRAFAPKSAEKPPQPEPEFEDEEEEFFRLRLSSEVIGSKKQQIKLVATGPAEDRYVLPLTRVEELVYVASAEALPRDDKYELKGSFEAEGKRRDRLFGESKVLEFERLPRKGRKAVEVVVVEKKQEQSVPLSPVWGMLLWLLVISGANVGLCLIGLSVLSKAQENIGDVAVVDLEPIDSIMAGLMVLEKKLQVVDIDLEDPIFTATTAVPLLSRKKAPEAKADAETAVAAGAAAGEVVSDDASSEDTLQEEAKDEAQDEAVEATEVEAETEEAETEEEGDAAESGLEEDSVAEESSDDIEEEAEPE
ncbi:MAG: VWA domain-containing protein [Deltaproteobacteria bacterium]|nr:VWA domain-containing protein [Deltaproteobacteria bacterium]